MRNVSSSNRLKADGEEEELLPPARLAGDTIRFDRCLGSHKLCSTAPPLTLRLSAIANREFAVLTATWQAHHGAA